MELADQIFVQLKHWFVGEFPPAFQWLVSAVVSGVALFSVFAGLFALTTVLERKGLGRIQNRYGPNRVGPFGLLQPLADGLKMLTKEDIVPRSADAAIHFLAPLALLVPIILSLAVLPVGRNMWAIDLDAGILFFFAVGASTELAVFMAGWASRNKYSLLGAMRAVAQMISYEVPLILSTVPVLMIAGSLSLPAIVERQGGFVGWIPHWNVFTPWGAASFGLFLIAAAAEANRSPFDLPEAESEIIAGHLMEYSGFKYALFFLGEYLGLFAASGLGITLFLGGWQPLIPGWDWVPSWIWFFGKLAGTIAFFIWVRGTLPRLRMDQLMALAWKFMLPMAMVSIGVAGCWHFSRAWKFSGALGVRWLLGAGILFAAYGLLGRGIFQRKGMGPRQYRFAE